MYTDMQKIVLTDASPGMNADSDELAKVLIARTGLTPRKKGSTEKMHLVLIRLYERAKTANQQKRPEEAVMTVEEMALFAGITRQTMYEYLSRWLDINLISKTSYIKDNKVIIGYKLNGTTLENAFLRVKEQVSSNLEQTQELIKEFQRILKNEKIKTRMHDKRTEPQLPSENDKEDKMEDIIPGDTEESDDYSDSDDLLD